jgi:hypothetical protein
MFLSFQFFTLFLTLWSLLVRALVCCRSSYFVYRDPIHSCTHFFVMFFPTSQFNLMYLIFYSLSPIALCCDIFPNKTSNWHQMAIDRGRTYTSSTCTLCSYNITNILISSVSVECNDHPHLNEDASPPHYWKSLFDFASVLWHLMHRDLFPQFYDFHHCLFHQSIQHVW